MSVLTPSPLLRFALVLDAGVSGLIALAQLLLIDWLAGATLLPAPLLGVTGAFMALYAGVLLWLARRAHLRGGWVRLIAFGNLGWALACTALAMSGLVPHAPPGAAYLAMQALGVVVFAVLQFKGLAASASHGSDVRMQRAV